MSKRVFRYHFDFLDGQARWLNRMAARGWRLSQCGIMSYEFEPCEPGAYQYAVELVGDKTASQVDRYRALLRELGHRSWTKNLNANYSVGHVRWRPWIKGRASIATSSGIGDTSRWNQELLIVERPAEDEPFLLHSDAADRLACCRAAQRSYLWGVLVLAALLAVVLVQTGLGACSLPLGGTLGALVLVFMVLYGVPAVKMTRKVRELTAEARIRE